MDPAELRADVPALEETVYLNTGASGPSPRRVVDAARQALEHHEFEAPAGQGMYEAGFEVFDETRAAVADHLGTDPGDVALTESTGDGMGKVAAAIDWEPGDVVVRTDLEHPAGVLPWERLERVHDVEVRVVETTGGHVDRDRWREAVEGARMAAFSSVCWTTGSRTDVQELTAIAQDAGARVLVDAVQSVGQHPVDVEAWGADAVAASGHKWLLGGWGAGFLYVDPAFAETLHPAQVGYFGVQEPMSEGYDLEPGAHRFEVGTYSVAPYAALQEALSVVEGVGYDVIEARIERLTDRLKEGLGADRLHSPRAYESGLVSFRVDEPPSAVEARLQEAGVTIREVPVEDTLRASVHVFNTAEDVDRLLELV